jgi:sodium/hydrogen antiporter
MEVAIWSSLIGVLLLSMALGGSVLSRLPISTSMLYLAVGVALSPWWLNVIFIDVTGSTSALELMAEIVVLISLFSSGLKLSVGLSDRRWLPPLRLAVISMLLTVAAVTAIGVGLLNLPLGAAILLGGILAPTDPVLASDVQVASPTDRDQLRFALTGEGGLNDGTAFPVVMLGLGLLGLHDIGPWASRWIFIDVIWASTVGLGVGALLGAATASLVIYLRRTHLEAVGLDNFLALGLIALAYGVALLLHAYGFLAVFAAGIALRFMERRISTEKEREGERNTRATGIQKSAAAPSEKTHAALADVATQTGAADAVATHHDHAAAFMAHAVLSFNEQVERIGEVAMVIVIGALLWAVDWTLVRWWFVPLLFILVRPLAVVIGLAGSRTSRPQRRLIAWFGIRGVGSLYYLTYAINHGVDAGLANLLTALTLSVVVASIILHGVSVTPLMRLYDRR